MISKKHPMRYSCVLMIILKYVLFDWYILYESVKQWNRPNKRMVKRNGNKWLDETGDAPTPHPRLLKLLFLIQEITMLYIKKKGGMQNSLQTPDVSLLQSWENMGNKMQIWPDNDERDEMSQGIPNVVTSGVTNRCTKEMFTAPPIKWPAVVNQPSLSPSLQREVPLCRCAGSGATSGLYLGIRVLLF